MLRLGQSCLSRSPNVCALVSNHWKKAGEYFPMSGNAVGTPRLRFSFLRSMSKTPRVRGVPSWKNMNGAERTDLGETRSIQLLLAIEKPRPTLRQAQDRRLRSTSALSAPLRGISHYSSSSEYRKREAGSRPPPYKIRLWDVTCSLSTHGAPTQSAICPRK